MNLRIILNAVRDELDAQQIAVTFQETDEGVIVQAKDYASKLIAKAELRRQGVLVLDK